MEAEDSSETFVPKYNVHVVASQKTVVLLAISGFSKVENYSLHYRGNTLTERGLFTKTEGGGGTKGSLLNEPCAQQQNDSDLLLT
jgi:hypothetical protein